MTNVLKASMLAAVCFSLCGTNAYSQSILNQSKDDLLKDFDVGKTLTAPPQFTGNGNPAPQPTWAPNQPSGAAPQGANPQAAGQQGIYPQGNNPPGSNPQPPALLGNYGQGPYQYQPQKGLMQRIIEGAMNAVNVTSNDTDGTHIKAPFINVDVGGQGPAVKVKAPFVKYDSDNGPQVKAPFTKYNMDDGIRIKAPFVDINHGGKGGKKTAPIAPQDPPQDPQKNPQYGTGDQGSSLR